jgi:hypothetical protein
MVEAIIKLLEVGLSLWLSKEKTKYWDRLMALKKDWYVESNKPDSARSDAVLDNIGFELRVLSLAFSAEAGKQNTQNQP